MTKILSIGEVMLEMSDMGGGLYKKSFAGDTFNVAHYLNVVTGGRIKAEYLTAVGEDAESEACLEFMREKGVLTSKCQRNPNRTIGLFVLSNDEHGEKQYGYWRGQSAARLLFDRPQDLSGYDLIYISGITAAITENRSNLIRSITSAKQQSAQIAYDFNHRVRLWEPGAARAFAEQILTLVDIAKISDEELAFLYSGKSVEEFSTAHPQAEWVLTCGGEKGEVWKNGNMLARQKFTAVTEVVDSSAAGDSFIATYIAEKFAGASPLEGLRRGHAIASQVVLGKGSIVAIDLSKLD
jgi:2-dehydro-3-deoxygluconokinase